MSLLVYPARRWGSKPEPGNPHIFDPGYVKELGLVGGWILNDTAPRDLSGWGGHASRVGNTPRNITTPNGVGHYFAGGANNHRLDLGESTSTDPISLVTTGDQGTWIFRSRLDSGATDFPRVIDRSDGGNGQNGWVVYFDNRSGNKRINLYYAGTVQVQSGTNAFTNGVWHDVIVRQSDADLDTSVAAQIHVDGVSVGTSAVKTGNIGTGTCRTAIGNWNHSTDRQWMGGIDYVYVFDTGLPLNDALRISREPYRYLVPERRRTYFIPAAGGGGNTGTIAADTRRNIAAFTGLVTGNVGTFAADTRRGAMAFSGTVTQGSVTGTLAAITRRVVTAFTGTVTQGNVTGTFAADTRRNVAAFSGQVMGRIGSFAATTRRNLMAFRQSAASPFNARGTILRLRNYLRFWR